MRWTGWIAAIGLCLAPSRATAHDTCPQGGVIADLPCEIEGSTSEDSDSVVEMYSGGASCTINERYPCRGDVFEVFLNGGSENIGFRLDLENSRADLVLVLTAENGTCLANSPDFIGRGAGPEAIPAASYDEGTYFVHVDTAELRENGQEVCAYGSYNLAVTGTNPPELDLRLTSRSQPDSPLAGDSLDLVHVVRVENPGPFRATGLELAVETSLPPAVRLLNLSVDRGELEDGTWSVGTLESGESATLQAVFSVGSGAPEGGVIETEARIDAVDQTSSGDSTHVARSVIRREVDLRLTPSAEPPGEVIAGAGTVSHTVTVRNEGPSDASELALRVETPKLQGVKVDPTAPSRGDFNVSSGIWTVGVLESGAQATLTIVFGIGTAAENDAVIRTRTAVTALAEDNIGDTETRARTTIRRQVTLELETDGPEEVKAGRQLFHTVQVRNDLLFDATELTLVETLTLPDGVDVLSMTPSRGDYDASTGTWTVDVLESGARATLEIVFDVDSSVVDGDVIRTRTDVTELAEINIGDTSTEASTTVRREVELDLATVSEPPDEVIAGDDAGLVFTVHVRNDGPSDASGLQLEETLTLPSGVDVLPRMPSRGVFDYEASTGMGTWTLGVLESGARATLDIVLDVGSSVAADSVIRSRTVVDDTSLGEPNTGARGTEESTWVSRRVYLDLDTDAVPPDEVIAGDDAGLVYTVHVHNDGPSDASGLVLEETLARPAQVGEPAITALRGDYEASTGTWTVGVLESGAGATLEIVLPVGSSAAAGAEISTATTVTALAEDNDGESDTSGSTTIRRETDLFLEKTAAGPVFSGDNLVYTLTVENLGDSDSTGGTICDTLPNGVNFVSSPDACAEADGMVRCEEDTVPSLTCRLDPVSTRETAQMRFVTRVMASGDTSFRNRAVVAANERDNDKENNIDTESTRVLFDSENDLPALRLFITDSPDPILRSETLTYTLTVVNDDPATADDITILATLSVDVTFLADESPGCQLDENDERQVACRLDELASEGSMQFEVTVQVNDDPAEDLLIMEADLTTRMEVVDRAKEVTSIAQDGDADLAVTQVGPAAPALPGQELVYTIAVSNNGPASSTGFMLEIILPDEAGFVDADAVPPMTCEAPSEDILPQVLTCDYAAVLDPGAEPVEVTVTVHVDAIDGLLVNTATVRGVEGDPNQDEDDPNFNNTSVESTTVVAPLLLPVFAVDRGDPRGMNTLFAVRNTAEVPVTLRYEVFDERGNPLLGDQVDLLGHANRAFDLRDLLVDETATAGFVAVTPVGGPAALSGDEIRLDAANGFAGGNLLLDLSASSVPRLCRQWDAGFTNGGAFDATTSFLFFVPALPASDTAVATGHVYTPDGDFVQELEVSHVGDCEWNSERAFECDSRQDLDLLAKTGTVEWTFRDGVAGSVAAVTSAAGRSSVAVPAFCKDELPGAGERPVPHLILPGFEVDSSTGLTTLFSVRNGGDTAVTLLYEYFDVNGQPLDVPDGSDMPDLAAHGAHTVDVGRLELAAGTGYATVTAIDPDTSEPLALHGESIRLDPQPDLDPDRAFASGEVLVDTRPELVPPNLCRLWNARFLNDSAIGVSTDFAFFIDSPGGGEERPVMGDVYDEAGNFLAEVTFTVSGQVFVKSSEELGLEAPFGAVEWRLPPGTVGHVSAVFKATNGFSAGIAAVCQDSLLPEP